jgi:hypothetical protein
LNTRASTSGFSEPRSTLPITPPFSRASPTECSLTISAKLSGSSASADIISLALPSESSTIWLISTLSNLGELSLKYCSTACVAADLFHHFFLVQAVVMNSSNSSRLTPSASR